EEQLRIMDGGRARWEEEGRPLVTEVPEYPEGDIVVAPRDDSRLRAFREDVLAHIERGGQLVDVRSPEEYRGERLHMPDYPNEGALRGGHIPGAKNVPWGRAVDPETHTFRPAAELRAIYEEEHGLRPGEDVVAYCRIGERSSHTWFVLTYLLGVENVRNYDGAGTEWGSSAPPPLLANPTATVSADASSHAAASEPHGTRYGISNTKRASPQPAAAASALPDSAATVPIARYSTARMRRISRARAPSVRSSALS